MVEQIRKLARDPDLARQVFEEASRQQQALIHKLETERNRLQRERQAKSEDIRWLVAAIAAIETPSPSVTGRLAELEAICAGMGRRLMNIDSKPVALEQNRIDPDHVAATLTEFDRMWEVMYPTERSRLIRSLVCSLPELRLGARGPVHPRCGDPTFPWCKSHVP